MFDIDNRILTVLLFVAFVAIIIYIMSGYCSYLDQRLTSVHDNVKANMSMMKTSNENIKSAFKSETGEMVAKFKTYSSEIVNQLRTINNIENQYVAHMSDRFGEIEMTEKLIAEA